MTRALSLMLAVCVAVFVMLPPLAPASINIAPNPIVDLQKRVDELSYKNKLMSIAMTMQHCLAVDGVNHSAWHVYKVVEEAYLISSFYPEIPMSDDLKAKHLVTFAYKETGFTPTMVGSHGELGICQTMPEDVLRLKESARKRGLKFNQSLKSIRTGLILCAEEFSEKIRRAGGSIRGGVWRYNGARKYGDGFSQALDTIKKIK